MKFLKRILGVKTQTPNCAVLGELGRYPLSLIAKERSVKYWLKIMNNPTSILYNSFIDQLNNIPIQYTSWAGNTIKSIDSIGYGDIVNNFLYNFNYMPSLKQRI